MKSGESASVLALGQLLKRLSVENGFKVDAFCEDEGASRSTMFSLVRDLESRGFVKRRPNGAIDCGDKLVALSYANSGTAALHGPALPICRELRDQTGCTIVLRTYGLGREPLLRLDGFAGDEDTEDRYTNLTDQHGWLRARLEVEIPQSRTADQRRDITVSLLAARAALLRHFIGRAEAWRDR